MNNILDYLKWRGDISFEEKPFNEIDNLILARISYLPFEKILENNKPITIENAYKLSNNRIKENDYLLLKDVELFELLSNCRRYKNLKLINFVNDFSVELEKQFAAITILLPKNYIYVSFRGTDDTIIGWKEDFNMAFLNNVPAQVEALKYLNNVKVHFLNKILVGGHSKGGNLAVYSSMYANRKIKNRIELITNIDGPGFLEEIVNSSSYKEIENKVKTYIPQTSIIGKLLNFDDGYITVKSNAKSIMQHDIYSWEVDINEFIYLEDVDNESKQIDKIITEWLSSLSLEKRKKMINIIFQMLGAADVLTFKELQRNWYKSFSSIYDSYKKINKEDKVMLDKIGNDLIKLAIKEIFEGNKKNK